MSGGAAARPASSSGGAAGAGGTSSAGGKGGSAGSGAAGPCDIYQSGNTPCVAAHSTVRALYGAYSGALYQVRRASDNTTKDIRVLTAEASPTSPCKTRSAPARPAPSRSSTTSPRTSNDLTSSRRRRLVAERRQRSERHRRARSRSVATPVYGIYVDNSGGSTGRRLSEQHHQGARNGRRARGHVHGADGKHYNQWCCFDYGNAETTNNDDGNATMEAIYFGNSTQWTRGGGNGPWVMADLENGMFEGDSTNAPSNTSIDLAAPTSRPCSRAPLETRWALKAGNAQSGALETKWNGKRPPGYSPMKKQGAIILGTGGDGSNTAKGTFFEGAMTVGYPPDAIDDAVQANIVAAGYGH